MASNTNVSVAVRIRPKLQREEIDMYNICTRCTPGEPQVWLGDDKAFTFDHVFDMSSKQSEIYDACVTSLIEGCFNGYNATILAYGQTGSGKTYTMGTGFDVTFPQEQRGIIPRAVEHLFENINKRRDQAKNDGLPMPEFSISTQFIEIYNDEIIDLLAENRNKRNRIRIMDDEGIVLLGVESKSVSTSDDTMHCLKSGSLFRTTGATLMNAESSRSHAIFTLFIKQTRIDLIKKEDDNETPEQEVITLTAKFNFVDLAGSERLSRTGAVGERAREGISINTGLLHLGNVISALGDRTRKMTHIPYRDSKLTRVLQDSLGGNSVTLMIACISPCDRDFVETLNTLRYANRAKNIKNKVTANQDSQTQLINELRRQIMQLQLENQELRQGKLFVKNDGEVELNDVYHENEMLRRELNNANVRIKALNTRLTDVNDENINLKENLVKYQIANNDGGGGGGGGGTSITNQNANEDAAESFIKAYLKEISDLRSRVVESEHLITHYRKQLNRTTNDEYETNGGMDIIEKAKHDVELGKSFYNQLNHSMSSPDSNGNRVTDLHDDDQEDFSEEDNTEDFETKLANHNVELANLMESLASKERLIEEFEARERRIIELTEQYEQKIVSFKMKIKQIEEDRDKLMGKIKKENKDDHTSKAKKEEYEKRISNLQADIRKYENLKREHKKMLSQESISKEQLKKLRQEVLEAKQHRVKLIAQMREQMGKHNKELLRNRIMINKLTREDQKKDMQIRNLETRSNQQKKILQRREEEIKNLKRLARPAYSDRVGGRLRRYMNGGSTPQKARDKWTQFEQKFNKIVALRTQFELEEKKLTRYYEDRQESIDLLNTLKENNDDYDYFESVKENIEYLDQCIKTSQGIIMQSEDENLNIDQLFDKLDPDETEYILNKLANSAINHAIVASQRDEELKEKDARCKNLTDEYVARSQLLDYLIETNKLQQLKYENDNYDDDILPHISDIPPSNPKYRRLTRTPAELLLPPQSQQEQEIKHQQLEMNRTFWLIKDNDKNNIDQQQQHCDSNSLMIQSMYESSNAANTVSSAGGVNPNKSSLNGGGGGGAASAVPVVCHVSNASSLNDTFNINESSTAVTGTPPGSPSINRRINRETTKSSTLMCSSMNNDSDVFSRLTGASTVSNQVENSIGQILPCTTASSSKAIDKQFPLTCTHSLDIDEHGSKDCTAKIWDLNQCTEVFSLNDHPDAVNVVRYEEYNKLIFTCSKSIIKIWDPRQKPINCVRTLSSTGLTTDLGNDIFIYDIQLSADGSILFSTSDRIVRAWDLRKFQPISRLNTGHNSLVTCLAVDDDEINDTRLVITGSKDHYVKVFELEQNLNGIYVPKYTLQPPHYDGIQALRLINKGRFLFSGGRDGYIKKWDLTAQSCMATYSNRGWVLALDTFLQETVLLSACRSGYLRLWSTENCHLFGEIQAHQMAVNDIATIQQTIFTASNDCTINLWQHRDSSPIEDIISH
ncbi:Kinesin-like protein kif21b, variant 2 [Dermatophagoides farinae]|uniref:Kinesin-like protein kif21b, variant 2 n=1 Tax=Dermatophagoides farinae TaxID=6954 RepID=A0A922I088_DERFA|nr:Kinesin-like protein kif21b, variant 2 [Dermatophagoides farinae]